MSREVILVVEDDLLCLNVLESELQSHGYRVTRAVSANEAIQATKKQPPDLMILDLTLIDDDPFNTLNDGFAFLQWLRLTLPHTRFPVIIHTADTSPSVDRRAEAFGISWVFRKGDNLEELLGAVRTLLGQPRRQEAA